MFARLVTRRLFSTRKMILPLARPPLARGFCEGGFDKFKRKNPVQDTPKQQAGSNQGSEKQQQQQQKNIDDLKKKMDEDAARQREQREKEQRMKQEQDRIKGQQQDQKQDQKNSASESENNDQENESDKKDKKENNQRNPQLQQLYGMFRQNHIGKILILGLLFFLLKDELFKGKEISNRQYLELLQSDEISKIQLITLSSSSKDLGYRAKIITISGQVFCLQIGNKETFESNLNEYQRKMGKNQRTFIPIKHSSITKFQYKAEKTLNILVSASIAYMIFKSFRGGSKSGGGMPDGFMKPSNTVKQFSVDSNVKVKFNDVAGLDQAKLEIVQFVDFLKHPQKYQKLGARIPKGALLSGPPGTGKTMLAKACAGQAGVPFFFMSGSDFVQMFVGLGAARVRDLFKAAKEKSPSIIFIDQIDAVGRKRQSKFGGNDERDNTLNQLLVEMDGFATDSNVIVLAATNRKELLDNALTRPGRFDRSVDVNLPDLDGRKQIFLVHLKPLKLNQVKSIEEYAKRLATLTPGFSGADISNLCNEAAILAARHGKANIQPIDFENASDRILAGSEKKKLVSEQERKVTAFHQSGHAVVSWFLQGASPLLKLTIVPRSKGSLGFAQYLPTQSSLETKEQLLDRICFILGGRCAEQFFFKRITTGAYDDLRKAYDMAHALVTKLGMSQRVGYIGFKESEYSKTYSEATNKIIDEEIKDIIDRCTVITRSMVQKHQGYIKNLAQKLLEKETLDSIDIKSVLGERPFPPKANFKAYLQEVEVAKTEQQGKENENVIKPDPVTS